MEITKESLEKLQKDLEYLKGTKRKEIAERLRRAISYGDLSENADYSNARDDQNFLERQIAELEDTIRGSTIISQSSKGDTIQVGSTVSLESNGEKFSFTITDPNLASPEEEKISSESPLGKALLGKKEGDKVEVQTPQAKTSYRILSIE